MLHITQKSLLRKLASGEAKTKNELRVNKQSRPHLQELVEAGYVSETIATLANNRPYDVYRITPEGVALLIEAPKKVEVAAPITREFKPWVMQDKTTYRPGSLDAFSKPSRYAGGVVDYKTSLK